MEFARKISLVAVGWMRYPFPGGAGAAVGGRLEPLHHMRILFTSTRGSHSKAVQLLSGQLDACADRDGFVRVDSPEEAEAIVFCEDYDPAELIWAKSMRAHPWIKKYPELCYTINSEDQPVGFLSGVYCSLVRRDYDPRRHRTWQYPRTANSLVAEVDPRDLFGTVPQHLASFAGAA